MTLVRPPTDGDAPIERQLQEFETALLSAIGDLSLPTEGVLVDLEQRRRVFANFRDAISHLDTGDRGRSLYLSKLLAAAAAGLFDAALNYLWDETISELRRRIADYDLAYFFDIAVSSPDRRKNLRTAEDLSRVEDQELIRAAQEIGLISDVGFQQLDLIRYMRNYASAAHPNQNEIGALQLVGWIETCIREVITLPESTLVAETKRLLLNTRAGHVNRDNAAATAEFFGELTSDQADNIAAGLFGIYVETESDEPARDGVRLLFPLLWPLVSEPKREALGVRYGRFVANGDADQAELARAILDVVDAAAYLPEPVRVNDISSAIDELLVAHRGYNNFHIEPGPARRLAALAGDSVPDGVRSAYVAALVEVFLTNGHGVARMADPHYVAMVSGFNPDEAELALLQLFEPTVSSKLQFTIPQAKYEELVALLDPKLTRPVARDMMDAINAFTGTPADIAKDTGLRRLSDRLSA